MDFITSDYAILFLLTSLGIILGKVKIKGISLDTSAIFFVALIFGHWGLRVPLIIQQTGLIFFMYSIGIQAGPGFFESFKKQGKQLLLVALVLSISGGIITIVLAKIFHVDILLAVGLFSGSLTSASSLAVTLENTQSALPSVGFGISFPFGVIAVVLLTRLSPKIFNIDLKKEEQLHLEDISMDYPKIFTKNYSVENPEIFDKTIGELKHRSITNTNILKLNFLRLLGALTGSMTSTPALSAIEPLTKTNAPQVAYATVYPIALILIIIVSQIILLL